LQLYSEVEPKFILQCWKDLRRFWHVLDRRGNRNLLEYNINFDHSLIIGGWNTLANFFGFENNVDVYFAYYGHRCFEILSFQHIYCPPQIKSFHSRSTNATCTKWFDIKLIAKMMQKTELVNSLPFNNDSHFISYLFLLPSLMIIILILFLLVINKQFSRFIRLYGWDELKVCTDDGKAN
jgi:hypothetical protein